MANLQETTPTATAEQKQLSSLPLSHSVYLRTRNTRTDMAFIMGEGLQVLSCAYHTEMRSCSFSVLPCSLTHHYCNFFCASIDSHQKCDIQQDNTVAVSHLHITSKLTQKISCDQKCFFLFSDNLKPSRKDLKKDFFSPVSLKIWMNFQKKFFSLKSII